MEILDKIIYRYLSKKNHPSIAVFVDDCVGLNVICHEVYEKDYLDLIINSLNEETLKNTLIDVGANIGNHSLYFSKCFQNVLSFEPQENIFLIFLRFIIRKISVNFKKELINYFDYPDRDYNLILSINTNSKFNIK